MHDSSPNEELQVVVFMVDGQVYGIDIAAVSEIIRPEKITVIPLAPVYARGVINLRGAVIPVVDMQVLFNTGSHHNCEDSRIIIAGSGDRRFGLMVDAVHEVKKFSAADLKPAPAGLGGDQRYLKGIILDGERLIVMVEPGKVLSQQDMEQLLTIKDHA